MYFVRTRKHSRGHNRFRNLKIDLEWQVDLRRPDVHSIFLEPRQRKIYATFMQLRLTLVILSRIHKDLFLNVFHLPNCLKIRTQLCKCMLRGRIETNNFKNKTRAISVYETHYGPCMRWCSCGANHSCVW